MTDTWAARFAVGDRIDQIAFLIMCFSQLAYFIMYAGAKWVGHHGYPPIEIAAARFGFSGLAALVLVLVHYGRSIPRLNRLGTHILRNLFLLGSNGFSFAALVHLHLAEVQSILYLSPFVTTAAAVLFLHERLRPRIVSGMLCAFFGVLLILRPDVSLQWGTFYALGMTICSGCYAAATRALGKREPPLVTLLFSGIMSAAVAGVLTLAVTTPVMPNRADVAVMAGIGLAGALGQLGLVVSHRMAEASRLAPLVYVQMPMALIAGFLLFGELPDDWSAVGIAVIVLAGVWVANPRQRRPLSMPAPAIAAPAPAIPVVSA